MINCFKIVDQLFSKLIQLLGIDFTLSKKFSVDKKIAPCITHYAPDKVQ